MFGAADNESGLSEKNFTIFMMLTHIADKARWDHYAPKRFAAELGGSVMMECQVGYVIEMFFRNEAHYSSSDS